MSTDRGKTGRGALKLAVTGGAASGKSAVCRRFRELGAFVVNLDRLSREVLAVGTPGLARVVDRFGKTVLAEDGELNRARLREIIVSDPKARRDLERIVHPAVLEKMNEKMAAAETAGAPLLVAEVPLLYEAGLEGGFDRVVVVAASEKVRLHRLVRRDGVTADQARRLIGIQMSETEKKEKADYVIENKAGLAELNKAVDRLFDRLAGNAEKDGESA